jgi:hypothetical protein
MIAAAIAMLALSAQPAQASGNSNSRPAEDPDQVICRAPHVILGSRVAQRRICKTRAEWRAFEEDRAQLRRDLQNSGRCPPRY